MIAAQRGCSERTIANELASAYEKLGISGRRELRALLTGHHRQQSPRAEWIRTALSTHESQILSLIAQGLSNKMAAHTLGISLSSVSTYLRRAKRKLELEQTGRPPAVAATAKAASIP